MLPGKFKSEVVSLKLNPRKFLHNVNTGTSNMM